MCGCPQVAGIVTVDDVVAKSALGHFEMPGQGALDLVVVRRWSDIQVGLRDIVAAAFKADVSHRGTIQLQRHGCSPVDRKGLNSRNNTTGTAQV